MRDEDVKLLRAVTEKLVQALVTERPSAGPLHVDYHEQNQPHPFAYVRDATRPSCYVCVSVWQEPLPGYPPADDLGYNQPPTRTVVHLSVDIEPSPDYCLTGRTGVVLMAIAREFWRQRDLHVTHMTRREQERQVIRQVAGEVPDVRLGQDRDGITVTVVVHTIEEIRALAGVVKFMRTPGMTQPEEEK